MYSPGKNGNAALRLPPCPHNPNSGSSWGAQDPTAGSVEWCYAIPGSDSIHAPSSVRGASGTPTGKKGFRGGLVFEAHRPVYHSTLCSRERKKREEEEEQERNWRTFLTLNATVKIPSPEPRRRMPRNPNPYTRMKFEAFMEAPTIPQSVTKSPVSAPCLLVLLAGIR